MLVKLQRFDNPGLVVSEDHGFFFFWGGRGAGSFWQTKGNLGEAS